MAPCMRGKSGKLAGGVQIDRLQKAADDAKHQLDSKENIVKELGRDGSKLDKERYAVGIVFAQCYVQFEYEFLCTLEVACKPAEDAAMCVV